MDDGRRKLLRSKKLELDGIVTSRKRKLRELFAVCDHGYEIPQLTLSGPNPTPIQPDEQRFLDLSDILQDRLFDESNLPRRQLRLNPSKPRSSLRKVSPDAPPNDAARKKPPKSQRDGSRPRKSRAATPTSRTDGGLAGPAPNGVHEDAPQGTSMQRSSSKGSQTDLPAESSALLDQIVEESIDNATRRRPSLPDAAGPPKDLGSDRTPTRVESRPSSPGVDPRKAMPISAEDAAHLQEPLVPGLGTHDAHHKAVIAHLPPREVQEQRLRDAQEAREQKEGREEQLSIQLPPRDGTRNAEALSSPSSTVDAQSAATPAMHDTSTDTSPDNDNSRYDTEGTEAKENDIPTPPELRHTPAEIAEKAKHDRLLQAQIDASRAAILRSSPTAAENQLLEEQAALDEADDSRAQDGASTNEQQGDDERLTRQASQVVEDEVEDQDEAINVPVRDEQPASKPPVTGAIEKGTQSKPREIADSEAEETPPVDAMDLDTATVKDSFESAAALDGAVTSRAPETVEPTAQPAPDSSGSSATPAGSTPRRPPSAPVAAPPLERMATRVSTGAMRHKSVSEILGEAPKPTSSSASARGDSDSPRNSHSPSRSTTPQSPGTRVRSLVERAREKERSKLSTVIFPGRPPKPATHDPAQTANEVPLPTDDYFLPLFVATTATEKRGGPSLENLLATAHKTITTSNAYVPLHENQTAKVLKRIYNLQCSNKWSLRQQKRSPEVVRPTTHWDVLLREAKWMRTDFREERKWKMAVARNLANACAEFHDASEEDRKLLKVNAYIPPDWKETSSANATDPSNDTDMGESSSQAGAHPTPDLVASGGSDSPVDDLDEEPRFSLTKTVSPTAIFGLQDDDVVFGLRKSPTTDRLLSELPMYGAPLVVPQSDFPTSEIDPDRFWRRPALPLSKYVEGRMELKLQPPPRKRSRYEYEEEDDDEDHVVFGEPKANRPILPPENSDVALFDPAHKATRERIHNSHQFRPPSEFLMPPQSFYENRHASQWTWDEDNQLKGLVREFNYNWGLISNYLTSKSMFSSGAERRTPWECFERWVQQEGMPADMGRTHYFRMYTNRIDTANRNVLAAAPPQQANANGQVQQLAPRRRPTSSVRVDRRRNQKHLTLVDAMRKLAKKRETSAQKQQHAAGMAAMRKANENPGPVNRQLSATTPQDFSRIKAEREEQLRERIQQMQQRQDQQRRLNDLQRRNAQNPQQAGLPNGIPPRPPTGSTMAASGTPTSGSQNLSVPGQNRPRPMAQMPGQPMPNGLRVPQMPMNGVPPAPMQGQLPLPNPALDVGLVTRAHQISQQQQQLLRQQQGQLPNGSPQMHNSPPRMNGMPQPGFPMQNNMMPPFNSNMNGIGTPPATSHPQPPGQGQAGSPRMGQPHMNGVGPAVHNLEQQILKQHPNATPDQITTYVREYLAKTVTRQQQQQQQRQGLAQSAMNAAAGGSPVNVMASMNGTGGGQGPTPQMYAQMLRQQQESQQRMQQAQQQAASIVGSGQGQGSSTGNAGQGHAHRGSTGSVQSGK